MTRQQAVQQQALHTAALVTRTLRRLGMFYVTQFGMVKGVQFDHIVTTADGAIIVLSVDTQRLPLNLNASKLASRALVEHLSAVLHHPVYISRRDNRGRHGIYYVIVTDPRVLAGKQQRLPRRVALPSLDQLERVVPETMRSAEYLVPLGVAPQGPFVRPLERLQHILVAGSTGGGKSNFLHMLIVSLLERHRNAADLTLRLIDPKRMELRRYRGVAQVEAAAWDADEALSVLRDSVAEMRRRNAMLDNVNARSLTEYRRRQDSEGWKPLPRLVVVIDELSALLLSRVKAPIRDALALLTSQGRAAGVHVVAAIPYPTKETIGGLNAVSFTSRLAFRVPDAATSRMILQRGGAEKLPDIPGRALFTMSSRVVPLQTYHIDDKRIRRVIAASGAIETLHNPADDTAISAPSRRTAPPYQFSDLELALVEYARVHLDGAFTINSLYEAFRGDRDEEEDNGTHGLHCSKVTIQRVAQRFEALGFLTPAPNRTTARQVTQKLLDALPDHETAQG